MPFSESCESQTFSKKKFFKIASLFCFNLPSHAAAAECAKGFFVFIAFDHPQSIN
jgi:hypothetical protein